VSRRHGHWHRPRGAADEHGRSGDPAPAATGGPDGGGGNILLADPDALDDDVLESCLYVYREKLRAS
jgi:hypothetical protein